MESFEPQPTKSQREPLSRNTLIWAWSIAAISLGFVLLTHHVKLLWIDEVLEFISDTKATMGLTIYDQVHRAFSLDPPAFHLILYPILKLFPSHPALVLRLPSFLSFLTIEGCAFWITYRLTRSQNSALLAMALPFALVTADYASEGRVYEMWTAMFALSIVFYQKAIDPERRSLALTLAGLLFSLSMVILLHYYGIFFGFALIVGEAYRSWKRRKLDWPVVLVLAGAYASFALHLPALPALHTAQASYVAGQAAWSAGQDSFLFIPLRYGVMKPIPHLGLGFCVLYALLSLLVLIAVWRYSLRQKTQSSDAAVLAVLTVTFCLPQALFLVSHFVTGAYSPRYGIPATIGVCVMVSLFLSPWLKRTHVAVPLLVLVMLYGMVFSLRVTYSKFKVRKAFIRDLHDRQDLALALSGQPDHHLYIQSMGGLDMLWFYADPSLRAAFMDVYSKEREMTWMHRGTPSIFASYVGLTTAIPTMRYEDLKHEPGAHIFLVFRDPENEWIDHEIDSKTINAEPVGKALGGTLYRVTFP
jgi:hypothetical protein